MARVQYGTIVTGLSGSVGGNVFARNINGNYTRRKSRNVNRNTISQANFRNAFGSIQRHWRSLTTSERNTWAVATPLYPYVNSLGVTSYYTSFQLFSKLNNQLFNVGVSPVLSAPTPVSIDGLVFNAAIYAVGSAVLAVSLTDTITAFAGRACWFYTSFIGYQLFKFRYRKASGECLSCYSRYPRWW